MRISSIFFELVSSSKQLFAAFSAGILLLMAPVSVQDAAAGDRRQKAINLVNEAADTTAYFAADTAFEALWDLADQAKAMVIIPEKIRAGFILGGAAGDAVMIARNKDGTWSQPTFLTIGSVSFGFQAGGEASELILLVMTDEGMESLLTSSVKLGGDISVAAGPYGAGAKAQTTDILAFARSRGLYGGLSLEGSYLKSRRNWNKAYYDADVTPIEIIVKSNVYNPASARLQNAVFALASRDSQNTSAPLVEGQPSTALPPTAAAAEIYEAPAYPEAGYSAPPQTSPSDGNENPNNVYEDDAVWGAPIRQ